MAPIRPLAWEPPYAARVAQERAKRQKKKKKLCSLHKSLVSVQMLYTFTFLNCNPFILAVSFQLLQAVLISNLFFLIII